MMNNHSMGAATPTTVNATVLSRAAGFKQAQGAMDSRTGSSHKGTDMNNKWTKTPGSGTGGNVNGYQGHKSGY